MSGSAEVAPAPEQSVDSGQQPAAIATGSSSETKDSEQGVATGDAGAPTGTTEVSTAGAAGTAAVEDPEQGIATGNPESAAAQSATPEGVTAATTPGQSTSYDIPDTVKAALSVIADYIAEECRELYNLKSINGDKVYRSDDEVVAGLSAYVLASVRDGVTNIAANKRRRDTGLAREELKQECRNIDARYGLSAPDADSINHQATIHRAAEVASWQLKQECRDIDAKYRISQLVQESSKLSSVVAGLADAIGQIDHHYPPGTEEAMKLFSNMLRDIDTVCNVASTLSTKIKEIAAPSPTLPDAAYEAEMPQAERGTTDVSDRAAVAREELRAELCAIDLEYAPKIHSQNASTAADAAARLHGELRTLLGDGHQAVKTVGVCCNLARACCNLARACCDLKKASDGCCEAARELNVLEQPDVTIDTDAEKELAARALGCVFDAVCSLGECYACTLAQCDEMLAAGVAGSEVMNSPSAFLTSVFVTAAQTLEVRF